MKKQMQLFDLPEKINIKRRKPLFRVEILSENGEIFVFWERTWFENLARKYAATEYNESKGFIAEASVEFGKVLKK